MHLCIYNTAILVVSFLYNKHIHVFSWRCLGAEVTSLNTVVNGGVVKLCGNIYIYLFHYLSQTLSHIIVTLPYRLDNRISDLSFM